MKKFWLMLTLFLCTTLAMAQTFHKENKMVKNIVLVHGAFTDGSSYRKVIDLLQQKGYRVTAVQNPLTSLADDVQAVNRVLDRQDGDVILVGHSWGGVVISEAGNHSKVKGLVYLSAIVPNDEQNAMTALATHGANADDLTPDNQGLIWLPNVEAYQTVMAHDLPLNQVAVLFATQTPIHANAFSETVANPAWQHKPSHYLLTQDDRALPFAVQQSFAKMINAHTKTVSGSHFSLLTQPEKVVELIEKATVNH